jgi:hypothetical protein
MLISPVSESGLTFQPASATFGALYGVEFCFYVGTDPHSIVCSTFESPSVPRNDSGACSSGYIVGDDDAGSEIYSFPVLSPDPIVSIVQRLYSFNIFKERILQSPR